jgi:hypothetical protein
MINSRYCGSKIFVAVIKKRLKVDHTQGQCKPVHTFTTFIPYMRWGTSVSIVSDYILDGRGSVPVRGKEFYTEAHSASYPMGSGGSLPGCKASPGSDVDHSPSSSAEVKMSRNYNSLPLSTCMASSEKALLFYYMHA